MPRVRVVLNIAPLALATCRSKGNLRIHEQRTGDIIELFQGIIRNEGQLHLRSLHMPLGGGSQVFGLGAMVAYLGCLQ